MFALSIIWLDHVYCNMVIHLSRRIIVVLFIWIKPSMVIHQMLMVYWISIVVIHTLLQDAANVTLRSETLRRNCVRCHNRKRWCKNSEKGCKTFAMTYASNTVQNLVACVIEGIQFSSVNCLRWGGTKETGSQMKVCAMYNIWFTQMNCLWLGNTK